LFGKRTIPTPNQTPCTIINKTLFIPLNMDTS
jgi:hypothetical protein